jgi:drug/metabolite transporter (DMT)-like permease
MFTKIGAAPLFLLTVLAWGGTNFAIEWQIAAAAPEPAIVYRYGLAALLMFGFVALRGMPLRFRLQDHLWFALLGAFFFSINYILLYHSQVYLVSGVVAITFSTMVLFNILFAAIFLGDRIHLNVVLGAVLGLSGIALMFWPDLVKFDIDGDALKGLGLSLMGSATASMASIVGARNQRAGLPIPSQNAWAMLYGTGIVAIVAVVRGAPWGVEWSWGLALSTLYLIPVATLLGFFLYFALIARIGPDRAGYVMIVYPLSAMVLSTLFEDYTWTPLSAIGAVVVLIGNVFAMTGRRSARKLPSVAPAAGS